MATKIITLNPENIDPKEALASITNTIKGGVFAGKPMPSTEEIQTAMASVVPRAVPIQVLYGSPRYENALLTLNPTEKLFVYFNNIPIETTVMELMNLGTKVEPKLSFESDKIRRELKKLGLKIREVKEADLLSASVVPIKRATPSQRVNKRTPLKMIPRGTNSTPPKKKRK